MVEGVSRETSSGSPTLLFHVKRVVRSAADPTSSRENGRACERQTQPLAGAMAFMRNVDTQRTATMRGLVLPCAILRAATCDPVLHVSRETSRTRVRACFPIAECGPL